MTPTRSQLALALLVTVACSEEPRVGIVDVRQAFQRSPLVMVSALQLKEELGSAQRDLKERGRALAELRRQLEYGGLELDAEERAQIERRIAEEIARLVELQREYRSDLSAARERRGEEMIARVEEVAQEVATERGLTLLLRKDGVLYNAEGTEAESVAGVDAVDLTEPVIRALLEKINPTRIPDAPAES